MEAFLTIFTPDLLIAIAILVMALVFVYTIGKDYAVTMNMAVYMAIGTMAFVPVIHNFTFVSIPAPYLSMIVFTLLVLLFGYLQTTNGFFEPIVVASGWESSVFAVTFTGMMIVVLASFVTPEMVAGFSPYIKNLFVSEPISSVWFLLPLAVLLFIRGDA